MSDRQGGSGWTLRGPEVIGAILVIVGLVAFLGNANIIRVSWSLVWPLLIIVVGGAILFSALRPRPCQRRARSQAVRNSQQRASCRRAISRLPTFCALI